jgi:hypothetical protein
MEVEEKVPKIVFCDGRPGPEEIERAEVEDQLLVIGVKINRGRYIRSDERKRKRMVKRRCDAECAEIGYPDGHPRVLVLANGTENEMQFRESVYQMLRA